MRIPILSDILDAIVRFATWVRNSIGYWWGVLIGLVLVPINWVCDRILDVIAYLDSRLDWVLDKIVEAVSNLNIAQLWGSAGPYLAKANAVVPLDFAITCCLLMLVIWVVCLVVRIVIHFLPIPTSG
jgi:hypothetical protein